MTRADIPGPVTLAPALGQLVQYVEPGRTEGRLGIVKDRRDGWLLVRPFRGAPHVRHLVLPDEVRPLTGSLGGAG